MPSRSPGLVRRRSGSISCQAEGETPWHVEDPAAFLLALAPLAPAAADVVCRPNALGTVSCPAPGPRPMARPVGKSVQALDRVRERSEVPAGTEFIPARRTDRLGGISTEGRRKLLPRRHARQPALPLRRSVTPPS